MAAFPHLDVSCVAKDSLFAAPFVGFLLRAMRAVPVAHATTVCTADERREMNAAFMSTCVERLLDDAKICIFPEGTCHSSAEVKELKTGTARMALQVASRTEGATRPPIVPVGLNYTQASGQMFRGSVLVDIGKPITITDEMIALFDSCPAGADEACERLTAALERHIRGVTIAVPDWCDELDALIARRVDIWSATYQLHSKMEAAAEAQGTVDAAGSSAAVEATAPLAPSLVQRRRRRHLCKIAVQTETGLRTFWSDVVRESSRDAHARRKAVGDKEGVLDGVAAPTALRRQAARRAFFAVSGAQGREVFGESDEVFLSCLHLARRVYKPEGASLSLGQYAALTRNFQTGYLRTDALVDPDFGEIWAKTAQYRRDLDLLQLTDKYVASHAIGDDAGDARLAVIRRRALKDLLNSAASFPLAAVGALLNGPVYLAARTAGERVGVDADGDRSVVATMFCLGGFVGGLAWYAAAAAGAGALAGSPFAVPCVTVAALAGSGYVSATRPLPRTVRRAKGALRLLLRDNNVDALRADRAQLQNMLRAAVDRYAPPAQREWYNKPKEAPSIIVSESDLAAAALTSLTIPLRRRTRRADERAVLRFKQRGSASRSGGAARQNRCALLWIPGRNDSFFHVHLLDGLLHRCGYDVFALDMRRCGEAKRAADSATPVVDELLAHDCGAFEEYFEEIDEVRACEGRLLWLRRRMSSFRDFFGFRDFFVLLSSVVTPALAAPLYPPSHVCP
jgi:1-acyl-sn-glycerol-3-phosphate acyltransferase